MFLARSISYKNVLFSLVHAEFTFFSSSNLALGETNEGGGRNERSFHISHLGKASDSHVYFPTGSYTS